MIIYSKHIFRVSRIYAVYDHIFDIMSAKNAIYTT